MQYKPRTVALSQICDQDQTFRITTRTQHEMLAASIEQIGLINRPILLEGSKNYLIVCGFARIETCRRLGWSNVPVNCVDAQTPRHICALAAVADNALQQCLNIVEQSRACILLRRFFTTPSELISAARSVGLNLNAELIVKLQLVHRMAQNLQSGLINGSIALPTALKVSSIQDQEAMESLISLLCELRLSLNRQKELIDWIEGIQGRERIRITEILAEKPLAQWRADPSLELPRKAQLIRQYLKNRRYPTITRIEERYAHLVQKVNFPPGFELSPPPQLEGRTFSLKIDFDNLTQLLQRTEEIRQLSRSAELIDLLDQKFIS